MPGWMCVAVVGLGFREAGTLTPQPSFRAKELWKTWVDLQLTGFGGIMV